MSELHRKYSRKEPDRLFVGQKRGVRHMSRWFGPTPVSDSSRVRVWPFSVLLVVVGLFLFGRLAQLTLVEGSYQRELADDNRVIGVRRAAARGIISDRNGVPLVRNVPVYKKQVPGTTVAQYQFEPISREEAVHLSYESGEKVFFDVDRDYLCGEACAILLGFTAEIDQDELDVNQESYVMGDTLGKTGMERVHEQDLRGVPGSELVEVNAAGQLVREVGRSYATAGIDVQTTIDSKLQQVMYAALAGRKGAVVAQVPQTGEVLALVSSPSFDPSNVAAALESEDMPFFNRAIGGIYPPGSVFKIVTSIAGLEEGVITGETEFEDTGEIRIDEYRYGNWFYDDYGRTDGQVDVVKALQRSNDIFYYRLGETVGANRLAEWARLMGMETAGGLEVYGGVGGTIPDPEWKEKTIGEKWFLGNTYHMSIGQGDVLVSPLQMNRVTSMVAAGGSLCPARMVMGQDGGESCMQMNLQQQTLDLVKEGMKQACDPGGTAWPLFGFTEPEIGCKTGTSQQGGEGDLPHAWLTAFAPLNNPEIAITVLVEAAGQGSDVAAPVAKEGLEYWFSGDEEVDLVSLGLVEEEGGGGGEGED